MKHANGSFIIGLDDTDTLESPGTGYLARLIAAELAVEYRVLGVTRHQLLFDPRVPYTAKNSCAAVTLEANGSADPLPLLAQVRAIMVANYVPGSDPGLCVAAGVPPRVTEFGRRAQKELVNQTEARAIADQLNLPLLGLGGTNDGIIGALAAVGLAACGDDGRYVLVGRSRDLAGLQPVSELLAAGVTAVRTTDGHAVTDGLVLTDKLRPARRKNQAIAVVEWQGDHWLPLKLD